MITDIDQLSRHSLWLSRLTLGLLVATAALILATFLIGPFRAAEDGLLLANLLHWLPTLFYLYALWAIHRAFRHFAQGGVFGPAIAAGCTHAGIALAAGGALSAVGIPNLRRLLSDSPGGSFLHFDTAYLAVGVVGLALVLLGRLLSHAAELQAEAAALKTELGEFL